MKRPTPTFLQHSLLQLTLWLLLQLWPYVALCGDIELAVITQVQSPQFKLAEIRQIYTGGPLSTHFRAVHWPQGHPSRIFFNTYILGLTEERFQTYWVQKKRAALIEAPATVSDQSAVLAFILNHPAAVGYILMPMQLPSNVQILYRIKTHVAD